MPEIPGIESYTGELIHARDYRGAEPFRGRDVLVIGAGNTGSEIAYWLIEGGASRVRVSMRTPPNIYPRKWLGAPLNPTAVMLEALPEPVADRMAQLTQRLIYGDLSRYGIPKAPYGPVGTIRVGMTAPAVDCGFVEAVKEGRIEIVGTIERFDAVELVMSDGSRTAPDVVIAATGYSRGLEPIVGHLGVLDEHGNPRAPDGRVDPAVPGLYFVGYVPRFSGQLREARLHARRLARSVAREPVPA